MPTIGFLHYGASASYGRFLTAFKTGLKEGGYVEGQNIAIEIRWGEGRIDRLPGLAAELVDLQVAVIATGGGEFPALAAKGATMSIPTVFVLGGDPIKLGLVQSFARPSGNMTGITMLSTLLESKRFGLLHEVIPAARTVAAMVNPKRAVNQSQVAEVRAAAAQAGVGVVIVNAASVSDFEPGFAGLAAQGVGALLICADPNLFSRRHELIALAARYHVPTMYEFRDFPEAGGLMSYGTDLADAYRQSGTYVAKILKGDRPVDLPVTQTTKFEFVINLVTAKKLGLEIAPTLLARADAVIE
jgi:putative ABC transport system substrate-binding protein